MRYFRFILLELTAIAPWSRAFFTRLFVSLPGSLNNGLLVRLAIFDDDHFTDFGRPIINCAYKDLKPGPDHFKSSGAMNFASGADVCPKGNSPGLSWLAKALCWHNTSSVVGWWAGFACGSKGLVWLNRITESSLRK